MKKHAIFCVIPVLALVLLAGCMTGNKMTDEEQVMQQTKAFAADVLAVNADNILNYVSEDFSHREVPSKAELAEHIQEARDSGRIAELVFKKDPDKVWRIVEVNIDGI